MTKVQKAQFDMRHRRYEFPSSPKGQRVFEKLWTVTDLAEHLRVPEKTIYDWVYKRSLPVYKVGRLSRFKPSEIEKWLCSERDSHYGN
jgi:excisionase family DNA binding protein